MSLEQDIKQAIDRDLPKQVSDRLQERFKELEFAEEELKKANKVIDRLREQEEEQAEKKREYQKKVEELLDKLLKWENREKELTYREEMVATREIRQEADTANIRNEMLQDTLNRMDRLVGLAFKNPHIKFDTSTTLSTHTRQRTSNGYMEDFKEETVSNTETKTAKEDYDHDE